MIDNERIIDALTDAIELAEKSVSPLTGCPIVRTTPEIAKAVIEYMEGQRPVTPSTDSDGFGLLCGNCYARIGKTWKYCTQCGKKIKK